MPTTAPLKSRPSPRGPPCPFLRPHGYALSARHRVLCWKCPSVCPRSVWVSCWSGQGRAVGGRGFQSRSGFSRAWLMGLVLRRVRSAPLPRDMLQRLLLPLRGRETRGPLAASLV